MKAGGFDSWRYASVGGLNATTDNREYFEQVRAIGACCSGLVEANLPRPALKNLLQRSRIFWHGMGLNEDLEANPGRAEHFGIATVEAMAAGCVPVVINNGGQTGIVTHDQNGFKWNTLEELKRYTQLLTDDAALWGRMSEAARARAQDFRRDRFIREMSATCGVRIDAARLDRSRAA